MSNRLNDSLEVPLGGLNGSLKTISSTGGSPRHSDPCGGDVTCHYPSVLAFNGVLMCKPGEEEEIKNALRVALKTCVKRDYLLNFQNEEERPKAQAATKTASNITTSKGKNGNKYQHPPSSRMFIPDSAGSVASTKPLLPSQTLQYLTSHMWRTPFVVVCCLLIVGLPLVVNLALSRENYPYAYPVTWAISSAICILVFPVLISQYSRAITWKVLKSFDYWFMLSEICSWLGATTWVRFRTNFELAPVFLSVLVVLATISWSQALMLADASGASRKKKGAIMIVGAFAMAHQMWSWGTSSNPLAGTVISWHPFKADIRSVASGSALTLVFFFIRYTINCFFPAIGGDAMLLTFSPKEVMVQGTEILDHQTSTPEEQQNTKQEEGSSIGFAPPTLSAGCSGEGRELQEDIPTSLFLREAAPEEVLAKNDNKLEDDEALDTRGWKVLYSKELGWEVPRLFEWFTL